MESKINSLFEEYNLDYSSYKNDDAVGNFPYEFKDFGALKNEALGFNDDFGREILKQKKIGLLKIIDQGVFKDCFSKEELKEIYRIVEQEKGWQLFYDFKGVVSDDKLMRYIPQALVDFSINSLLYSKISEFQGYPTLFNESINPMSPIYSVFSEENFRKRVVNGAFWKFAEGAHSGWDPDTFLQEFLLSQNNHLLNVKYSLLGNKNLDNQNLGSCFYFKKLSFRALSNYSKFTAEVFKKQKDLSDKLIFPFVEAVNRRHSHFKNCVVFDDGRKEYLLKPLKDVGIECDI